MSIHVHACVLIPIPTPDVFLCCMYPQLFAGKKHTLSHFSEPDSVVPGTVTVAVLGVGCLTCFDLTVGALVRFGQAFPGIGLAYAGANRETGPGQKYAIAEAVILGMPACMMAVMGIRLVGSAVCGVVNSCISRVNL